MKKSRFSESQILVILKEYETGRSVYDLARKYRFHHQTLYDWKKYYSGVENPSELVRLKKLESENARLKKIYANLSLAYEALKDVLSKKW